MSYTGVRKFKTIIDDEGKYNISCEAYDSSIYTWDYKRDWHSYPKFLETGFDTKEELEYFIFQQALDGNIHGVGGKYSCISWSSRSKKLELSEEEYKKLKELEDKKYSLMYSDEIKRLERELRDKGIEYKDMKSVCPEYKRLREESQKACDEYTNYRYNTWYKAWKKYLEEQKNISKDRRTYIVRVNYTYYNNIFISSHGSRTTKFTNYFNQAKLFTSTIEELKKEFCGDDYRSQQYSKVSIIDVTDYIVGKGKYRHANMDYNDIAKNTIVLK